MAEEILPSTSLQIMLPLLVSTDVNKYQKIMKSFTSDKKSTNKFKQYVLVMRFTGITQRVSKSEKNIDIELKESDDEIEAATNNSVQNEAVAAATAVLRAQININNNNMNTNNMTNK